MPASTIGWYHGHDVAPLDGHPDRVFLLDTAGQHVAQTLAEDLDPVAPGFLRVVEGAVSLSEDVETHGAPVGHQRHADRRGDGELPTLEVDRLGHSLADAVGQRHRSRAGIGFGVRERHDGHELVNRPAGPAGPCRGAQYRSAPPWW